MSSRPPAQSLPARGLPARGLRTLGLLALLGLAPLSAHAQQIVIELDEQRAEQLGLDANALEADLRGQMGDDLKLDEQEEFLRQMGAANLMASKGMGVDYASNPQRFVFGGGVGTAVNAAGARFGKGDEGLPTGGFAFQAALLAGLNLGVASGNDSALRRFVLYVDGMVAETNPEPFHASTTNVATHLQVKLVRPKDHDGLIEWGGLDLTSGYEWSRYRLELSKELPVETDGLAWEATGTLAIESDAASVPIELSSNFRVLVLSAYLGAAADLALDSVTDSEIILAGPVFVDVQGGPENIGAASLSLEGQGLVDGVTGRLFGGAQVNIFFVKVYGHLNVGLDRSFGGHLGGRVAL